MFHYQNYKFEILAAGGVQEARYLNFELLTEYIEDSQFKISADYLPQVVVESSKMK